ncbi:hypothetical protein CBS101457_001495 [Exobasidium rhododendri]|nr:hypothetical protein CBS101457_001495 [Exobasidium rhododendri]
MAPSTSKGKGSTQQSLLGFFAKSSATTNSGASKTKVTTPPSTALQPTISASSSFSNANEADDDSSLTPPPTIRKGVQAAQSNGQRFSSHSQSPTELRGPQKNTSQANVHLPRRTNELTPPSSSPPVVDDGEEMELDNEDQVTRFPRRRAALKRRIKYVESDEEGLSQNGGDDDDGDDDCFSPEEDDRRLSSKKKNKNARNRSPSEEDDDDDEFDDFIVPDEELLGALETAEATPRPRKQKPPPTKTTKNNVPSTSYNAPEPKASSSAWSSTSKPFPGTLAARNSANANNTKQKGSNEDLPYDFLLHPLDENRNAPNHPDFDPRTLYVPERTMKTLTPFEKQYWEIKRKHNDTVLFFQKGKFFELYEDDALIAHREFGLKVTDRVKMKMAGVPESSYTTFANKFLALGYKVGRVDQTETAVGKDMRQSAAGPKARSAASSAAASDDSGSKIVRRDLRSIMTSGTIVDSDCLPDEMSSYCISIKEVVDDSLQARITFGICILDAGVAQFKLHHFVDDATRTRLETLLQSLRIKEVIYEKGHLSKRTLRILRNTVDSACNITMLKSEVEFLNEEMTMRKLNLIFNKDFADLDATTIDLETIEPVDPALLPPAIVQSLDKAEAVSALGGMLSYLTQLRLEKDICASMNFDIFDPLSRNECMILDAQSLTHLNVLINEQGDGEGTLLQLVNRAVTPFGKRLMKVWLLSPLAKIESIQHRQDAVEEFIRDSTLPDTFDAFAKSLPDIERIMPRIAAGKCKSRDFAKVLKSLSRMDKHVQSWKELASDYDSSVISEMLNEMPLVSPPAKEIQDKYEDESFEPRAGMDEGYDEAVESIRQIERQLNDELRAAAKLVKLPSDKVKFKDVGTNEIYQIEVPIKTAVPEDWALTSQTQSVKRYYSAQIRALVKRLKEARETRVAALKLFQATLFVEFQQVGEVFLQAVKGIAELDCLISLSKASTAMNEPTCRAEFVESEDAFLDFADLRHPCLANATSTSEFISNDIQLGGQGGGGEEEEEEEEKPTVTILTGGNMAGKSTTARTTATGVILAQLGCRVPAISARLSPIDRIATRMGANDQLFRNNSTFMVEMLEASRILKDGTPRSLVIMDELGRGTSTFDGQAIAYSVLHYLIGQSRSLCFFLTHYTQLAYDFEGHLGVRNKHMQVLVDSEHKEVVFTYKLIDGIAESSYGTEVAALAGIPDEICERAKSISSKFLESTREMELQRKHNVASKLDTSMISDFVHLFKAGMLANKSAEESDGEALSGKTIAFMRRQAEHLIAGIDSKITSCLPIQYTCSTVPLICRLFPSSFFSNTAAATTAAAATSQRKPAQYSRTSKRPRLGDDVDAVDDDDDGNNNGAEMGEKKRCDAPFTKKGSARKAEQLVLDLGQKMQMTCRDCGMSFDRSEEDDVQTHEKYHSRLTRGIEWTGKQLLRQARQLSFTAGGGKAGGKPDSFVIFAYDDWSPSFLDNHTTQKLQEVQTIMEEALGANPFPTSLRQRTKFIVLVSQGRVLGSLIAGTTPKGKARRVEEAGGTTGGSNDAGSMRLGKHLACEDTPPLAIYRIHVLPFARRRGVATAMLDAALQDCVYGMSTRALIEMHGGKGNTAAFSQPTQAGKRLALSWLQDKESDPSQQVTQLIVFDEDED